MAKKEKEQLLEIEKIFVKMKDEYKKDHSSKSISTQIPQSMISDMFGIHANIVLVDVEPNKPFFVMCVYPHQSTVDKLIDVVLHQKNSVKAISDLWKKTKDWTIEIDTRIFNDDIINLTEKELTAILLHEIGHVVADNSIPVRLSVILRFEIAKANMHTRNIMNSKLFKGLLSLPVLDACIGDKNASEKSIKNEIKADNHAKKYGYRIDLLSAIKKLYECKLFPKNQDIDRSIETTASYAINTIDQFNKRADNLIKKSLVDLKESCDSPYLKSCVNDIILTFYENDNPVIDEFNDTKVYKIHEIVDKMQTPKAVCEAFFFGKKPLKRIDPNELDYITLKVDTIKTESDKMMIISYINSKLDIIEYYESILLNDKWSNKYDVPYTLSQIKELKERLNKNKKDVFKYEIPKKSPYLIQVAYPDGYEG